MLGFKVRRPASSKPESAHPYQGPSSRPSYSLVNVTHDSVPRPVGYLTASILAGRDQLADCPGQGARVRAMLLQRCFENVADLVVGDHPTR